MAEDSYKFAYLEESCEKLTNLGKERVFLAKHRGSGQICVLKYVDARAIPAVAQLAKIENIHLERVIDWAVNGEQGIVVTRYIAGKTLRQCMDEEGPWSEERVRTLARELLALLTEVHGLGIVHRDINPRNILISDDGVMKLIDFDIARIRKPGQKKDTVVLGTVGYAAPEQFGFEQTDGRSDLYAVGVLMNELLTGKLLGDFLYSEGQMGRVIQKATMIDAGQRYQSAEEMAEALEERASKRPGFRNQIPGFRTGVIWKEIVATFGYILMGIWSVSYVWDCRGSWTALFLEIAAVFLYVWLATLILANVGDWDRRLWPVKRWPIGARLALRIFLWFLLFSAGIFLENYVRYDLLGLPRPST